MPRPLIPARVRAAVVVVALVAACSPAVGGGSAAPSSSPEAFDPPTPLTPSPSASGSPSASDGSSHHLGTPRPIDGQLFGMAGHLMWHSPTEAIRALDMLDRDGFGVVRFDVSWRNSEPSAGRYAFLDKLDGIVHAARERGIAVIIAVLETPDWANGGRGAWVPPTDPATYARFVGMLAARYAGQVLGWEVWNEPDLALFWKPTPDPAAYTHLLVPAAAAIRKADPTARVAVGGIAFANVRFLQGMYDAGARGSFDVLALHPYTLTEGPDDTSNPQYSLVMTLDAMRDALAERGDEGMPIWITEFGWAVVGLNSVSEAKRVAYLGRTVPLVRARPWVQVLTVYTIDVADSARYGLSRNGVRSAAWTAYADAVRGETQGAAEARTP